MDTLEEWIAREREVTGGRNEANVGVATREQVAGLSGLEIMQRMIRGEIPVAPIGKTLGFVLLEAENGHTVFQGTPSPSLLNPMGTVHGGWYATLLDSAMGCAVACALPAGRGYTTAELSVNMVRAIGRDVQRVRAEAKVIHCGRQLATAEGKLFGPDGTLYAHGTTTCLVFEVK